MLYEKEISRIATLIPKNTHRSFSAQLFSSCTFLRVPSEGTHVCCGLEIVAQTNLSKCQDGKERSIPKMEVKLPGDGLELRLISFVMCVNTNTFNVAASMATGQAAWRQNGGTRSGQPPKGRSQQEIPNSNNRNMSGGSAPASDVCRFRLREGTHCRPLDG